MGRSLGRRPGRRRPGEIEASPQAIYLKVLGELGSLTFDPELRTAAQLAGMSAVDGPGTSVRSAAAQDQSASGASPEATTTYPFQPLRLLEGPGGD